MSAQDFLCVSTVAPPIPFSKSSNICCVRISRDASRLFAISTFHHHEMKKTFTVLECVSLVGSQAASCAVEEPLGRALACFSSCDRFVYLIGETVFGPSSDVKVVVSKHDAKTAEQLSRAVLFEDASSPISYPHSVVVMRDSSENKELLIIGDENGGVHIFDAETFSVHVKVAFLPFRNTVSVFSGGNDRCLLVEPVGKMRSGGDFLDGQPAYHPPCAPQLLTFRGGNIIFPTALNNYRRKVTHAEFSLDGRFLALASTLRQSREIHVFEVRRILEADDSADWREQGCMVSGFPLSSGENATAWQVASLLFSPSGCFLIVGMSVMAFDAWRIYSVAGHQLVQEILMPGLSLSSARVVTTSSGSAKIAAVHCSRVTEPQTTESDATMPSLYFLESHCL